MSYQKEQNKIICFKVKAKSLIFIKLKEAISFLLFLFAKRFDGVYDYNIYNTYSIKKLLINSRIHNFF